MLTYTQCLWQPQVGTTLHPLNDFQSLISCYSKLFYATLQIEDHKTSSMTSFMKASPRNFSRIVCQIKCSKSFLSSKANFANFLAISTNDLLCLSIIVVKQNFIGRHSKSKLCFPVYEFSFAKSVFLYLIACVTFLLASYQL